MKIKIDQKHVDFLFSYKMNQDAIALEFLDDIEYGKKLLNKHFGITISTSEFICFWEWWSQQLDASWLSLKDYPEKILAKNFQEFIDDWFEEDYCA